MQHPTRRRVMAKVSHIGQIIQLPVDDLDLPGQLRRSLICMNDLHHLDRVCRVGIYLSVYVTVLAHMLAGWNLYDTALAQRFITENIRSRLSRW